EHSRVEPRAVDRLCEPAKVLKTKRFQLRAYEGAVFALDVLVLVGPRGKTAARRIPRLRGEQREARIPGLRGEQLLQLGGQPAQKVALLGAEVHAEVTPGGALDRCGR